MMCYARLHLALTGLLLAATGAMAVAEALADEKLDPSVPQFEQARIEAIESVRPTVVSIFGKVRQGGGSGVLISPDGLVLTNFHVVAGAGGEQGWAGLSDGVLYPWKLIGLDPGGDLALIQLTNDPPDKPFPYAVLGSAASLKQGDWVMAMGNPFALNEDLRPTVTMGIVSGLQRYQGGTGPRKTMLVYGNCIQVDTSINPGNSGGPLFDMAGRVVGINGRASFEARGRVNVGLGYAISAEQCLYFLPELMAAKVAQHGWLDEATFGDRGGRVVCDKIDYDSPIGQLGLRLGDELLQFNGRPIQTANRFTNQLSMLPAHWPVTLRVRTGSDKPRTLRMRLGALDYGPMPDKPTMPDGDKPEKSKKQLLPRRGPLSKTKPGGVIDEQVNRAMAELILRKYRQTLGGDAALSRVKAIRVNQSYRDSVGAAPREFTADSLLALDGRFRHEIKRKRRTGHDPDTESNRHVTQILWNGERMIRAGGDEVNEKSMERARKSMYMPRRTALMALYRPDGIDHFKQVQLEGADQAQGRIAALIAANDGHGNRFRFYFELYRADVGFRVRLLKHGVSRLGGKWQYFLVGRPQPIGHGIRYAPTIAEGGSAQDPIARYSPAQAVALTELPDGIFENPDVPLPAIHARAEISNGTETPKDNVHPYDPCPNVFSPAIAYAQRRCVKIYGAGIGREKGYASGIIVSNDGLILTAQGVYLIGRRINVALPDGSIHRAHVVRTNDDIQAALLQIDAETPDYFDVPAESAALPGDWVLALANPFNVADFEEPLSLNLGVVSMRAALDTRRRAQDFDVRGEVLLIDAIVSNPGSAGGAVVGLDGRLVGMVGKLLESQSTNTRLNYAIPADLLRRFLDGEPVNDAAAADVDPTDTVPGYVGLRLFTLPGRRAPAYIDRVTPGSPAAKAGLRKDDLILVIDGRMVRNIKDYQEIEKTLYADRTYRFMIKRGEEIIEKSLTPARKP